MVFAIDDVVVEWSESTGQPLQNPPDNGGVWKVNHGTRTVGVFQNKQNAIQRAKNYAKDKSAGLTLKIKNKNGSVSRTHEYEDDDPGLVNQDPEDILDF